MRRKHLSKGAIFKDKIPCVLSNCSSSDAAHVYFHQEESRYSYHCYSCNNSMYSIDPDTMEKINQKVIEQEEKTEEEVFDMDSVETIRDEFKSDKLSARKISASTAELYGVKVEFKQVEGELKQVGHYYPNYRDDKVCGYSARLTYEEGDKQVEKKPALLGKMKKFTAIGDCKTDVQLFGQKAFPAGKSKFGTRIFITTGQEDALAGYQMTKKMSKGDTGYPFVSVVGGDQGGIKNLKANLSYVSQFDEIYLCADKDSSGKEFEKEACKILPVGKVKIVKWDEKKFKDLSDFWNKPNKEDRCINAKRFWSAIWSAEDYSPAGIKSLSSGWEEYLHRGEDPLIPFPDSFGELNALTFGGYGADGEIINIAAPSSVGKSLFVKEMVYTALQKTNKNVGVISLEETLPEFLEGMLSIHMNTQLNEIPFDERDRGAEYNCFQDLLKVNNPEGHDRIHFLDDPGGVKDEDDLWDKINFLIQGLDCSIIILDPVTLALSLGIDEDGFNSDVVKTVKRNKLAWINVHHVRKSMGSGPANSEGGDLSEEDMKGSGSHFQTGMINLILTRNKVHETEEIRNTTRIKMSKCRRHGKNTGVAGYVHYNGSTGRLEKGVSPKEIEESMQDMMDDGEDVDKYAA